MALQFTARIFGPSWGKGKEGVDHLYILTFAGLKTVRRRKQRGKAEIFLTATGKKGLAEIEKKDETGRTPVHSDEKRTGEDRHQHQGVEVSRYPGGKVAFAQDVGGNNFYRKQKMGKDPPGRLSQTGDKRKERNKPPTIKGWVKKSRAVFSVQSQ